MFMLPDDEAELNQKVNLSRKILSKLYIISIERNKRKCSTKIDFTMSVVLDLM